MIKKIAIGLGIAAGVVLAVWLVMWVWVLSSQDTLNNPTADWPIWPVACSTRGCVTSARWMARHQLAIAFARATNQDIPSPAVSLTSTIRQHLVSHAFLKSPVTLNDAKRYREDVLRLKNAEKIQSTLGVGESIYDRDIILPLLQQEALKGELKVESTEELYKVLSEERLIVLLPFQLKWDAETGTVSGNN